MAKTTIDLNKVLVLKATDRARRFTPYKENYVTTVPAGKSLYLKAKTVGQYLYYTKNGFEEHGDAYPAAVDTDNIVINVPATITIENKTNKVMNFIPYRENFQAEVASGDSYEFEAETAGQVLYYIAQDTTGYDVAGNGLEVTQVAKSS